MKDEIQTENAPAAIGSYSQAVKTGNTVYISGQIPLNPETMEVVDGSIADSIHQVFTNLRGVCNAAGGGLNDIVKLNVYLTDLSHFATLNEIMGEYFETPYPARAAVGVASLPKQVQVEMDAVLVLQF